MQEAWEQVSATVKEIEELTTQIRQSLKSQQDEHLLPHVLRLLELRPDDTRLSRLAKKLKQRHDQRDLRVAEQRLRRSRDLIASQAYEQAARELAEVNADLLPAKSRELYDTALELAWILNEVRTTPFVTPQLGAILQRWRQLQPKDPRAKRLEDEFARRWKRRQRNQHFPMLWGKSPSTTRLGLPILRWQGTERACVTNDASPITDRLMLAYGLALQGLGIARLKMNLLPRERGSWWRRLSALRDAQSASPVWGIDLGTSALKAVELRLDSPQDEVEVTRTVCLPHQHPLNATESDDQVTEICRETIARFVTHCQLTRTSAVIGFPGPRSLGRSFEIPRLKASKLDEVIAYEARIQIPVPLEEIVFDWHVWPDEEPDSRMQSVTMLAARKIHIQRLLAPLADSPIQPIAVQSDCLALYNAAAHEFWPAPEAAEQTVKPPFAVLEIGTEATNLVLVSPCGIRYRSLSIGTERMNRSLIQRFQLPRNKVEQLRQQPAAAKWIYQVDEELRPLFLELVQDTQRTLVAYQADGMHAGELFVTGGGAGQHGLLREFIRDTTAGEVDPEESEA
jgi:type IV pilus assembly protein PilM